MTVLGFEESEAQLLIAFVPMALSRPVLEQLGVAEFPETVSVPTDEGGWIEVPLCRQPEYVATLDLAREHVRRPCIPPAVFKEIVYSCATVAAADTALNAGADLEGSVIASAVIDRSFVPI